MDIRIRPATVTDAASVSRLMGQLGYDVTPEAAAARLSRIVGRSDHQFLLAEAGGVAVGCLHISLSEHVDADTAVLIEGVVVDRAHRGTGIGRQLIARAEEWGRANGCALVRLRSTDARTEAHRFYERLGYAKIKTQFAFAKSLDGDGGASLARLVPRVDG
jgi:GNAT superfamily N-acetyltransferase